MMGLLENFRARVLARAGAVPLPACGSGSKPPDWPCGLRGGMRPGRPGPPRPRLAFAGRSRRSASVVELGRFGAAFAAILIAFALSCTAGPAAAQTTTVTYVSNTDQGNTAEHSGMEFAQNFTTGPQEGSAAGWSIADESRHVPGSSWSTRTNSISVSIKHTTPAPTAADNTITTPEDTAYAFGPGDFNFSGADMDDTLERVTVVTLPADGMLTLDGSAVTADQTVTSADIEAGKFSYAPPANANGTGNASFTFKVSDGTAESAATYTMTIDVDAVDDSPTDAPANPPLTAQFENAPDTHDGSSQFTVDIRFSENVRLSASAFRNGLLTITGGTRSNQRRLVPRNSIRWQIDVTPDGNADVIITLPAIQTCDSSVAPCTPDGRPLSAPVAVPREAGLAGTLAGQPLGGFAEDPAPVDAQGEDTREGLETIAEWLDGTAEEDDEDGLGARTMSGRELLSTSSFSLTQGAAESGFASFWGRGVVTRFDGRDGERTLDGEVASAMVGADWSRDALLGGLMVSHSRGEGSYRDGSGAGTVESTLTALFPYARYAFSERVSVWGMAGYGEGTLTVTPEGQAPLSPDMDFLMGALGVRGVLLDGGHDGTTLAAKSDAFAVRTSTGAVSGRAGNLEASRADVTRVRFALEGSRPVRLGESAVLTPSLELGVRHDGGDAETGFGADLGAGLALSEPRRSRCASRRRASTPPTTTVRRRTPSGCSSGRAGEWQADSEMDSRCESGGRKGLTNRLRREPCAGHREVPCEVSADPAHGEDPNRPCSSWVRIPRLQDQAGQAADEAAGHADHERDSQGRALCVSPRKITPALRGPNPQADSAQGPREYAGAAGRHQPGDPRRPCWSASGSRKWGSVRCWKKHSRSVSTVGWLALTQNTKWAPRRWR